MVRQPEQQLSSPQEESGSCKRKARREKDAKKTDRSRPDRAAKLSARKTLIETVVKSSLLKYVRGDEAFKGAFVDACRRRVDAFSRRIVMASIRMSGLVKRLFDGQSDVCSVNLPDIFDTTFVRQLMLGLDHANKPDPNVKAFLEAHPDGLEQLVGGRLDGDRNIYCYGASKYVTNMRNAFKVTFRQRLVKYLKHVQKDFEFSNEQRSALLFRIAGWKMPKDVETIDVSEGKLQDFIKEQRRVLGLSGVASADDAWFDRKKNLQSVLRQWVTFNRVYEAKGLPLFSILPTCKVRHHFITIDTSSLYGVLKEIGTLDGNFEDFDALRKDHWYSVLDLAKFEDKTGVRSFSFTMDTDAVSACTHWTRPKITTTDDSKGCSAAPLDPLAVRVVAVDPGRVIIYYAVEQMSNGSFKTYTLSRREYYNTSGVFEAREQTERWTEGIRTVLSEYSKASIKGVDLQHHEAFVDAYKTASTALWTEYTKSRWARQRLRLYGGKKRAFSRFFNMVERSDDRPELERPIVFAYGSASIGTGGKGELSAPTSRAFKECSRRYKCKPIDEYRSSKTEWRTGAVLQLVSVSTRRQGAKGARGGCIGQHSRPLRGLLWYDSTIDNRQSKFVGRDFNAALCIWRCATEATRPEALTRRAGQPKIVQTVGKIINHRIEPARWR